MKLNDTVFLTASAVQDLKNLLREKQKNNPLRNTLRSEGYWMAMEDSISIVSRFLESKKTKTVLEEVSNT